MVLLLSACVHEPEPPIAAEDTAEVAESCSAEVTASLVETGVATAPRLEWSTELPGSSRIRFTNGEDRTRETAADVAQTEHAATLVGILPETSFTFQVLVDDGSGERCVGEGVGTAGALPAGAPTVAAMSGAGRTPGLTVVPVLSGSQQVDNWLLVLDEEGRVVWAVSVSAVAEMPVFVTTAAFAKDGSGVLFNTQGSTAETPGWIAKASFEGELSVLAEVRGLHTDFVELDPGRFASLTWEVRDVGDWRLLGDHVVVIEEGRVRSIWNSFDEVPFDDTAAWSGGFYPADPEVVDWSHVNSIAWDEASNDLVVTMTVAGGVARLSAETGETRWLYGEEVGDFAGDADLTAAPHSAEILPDGGVLVFNRGDFWTDPSATCAWAAELAVDEAAKRVSELGRWSGPECTLVTYLGLARRLPDEVTLVNWTSAGRIDQLSAAGEPVWSVALEAGNAFGNSQFLPTGP